MDEIKFEKEVDARGLNCPLPVLKVKKAMSEMSSGQVVRLIATDVESPKDIMAFAEQTGNTLLSHQDSAEGFVFYLRRR